MLFCHAFGSVYAQQATLRLEPDSIAIGQQAELMIELQTSDHGHVLWPLLNDSITSQLEIIHQGQPDTTGISPGQVTIKKKIFITAWQEGFHPIPRMEFKYIAGADTLMFFSNASLLSVQGVEVDMETQYKDIKPLFSAPLTFREVIPWVLGVLVSAILIIGLLKWLKDRKRITKEPDIWNNPDVPAHIAAISSLETLRRKELWQKGEVKAYHSELTTILRLYLSKRYTFPALEMTTSELMQVLPEYTTDNKLDRSVQTVLGLADLVKFARHLPKEEDNQDVLELALAFVKATIPPLKHHK